MAPRGKEMLKSNAVLASQGKSFLIHAGSQHVRPKVWPTNFFSGRVSSS